MVENISRSNLLININETSLNTNVTQKGAIWGHGGMQFH